MLYVDLVFNNAYENLLVKMSENEKEDLLIPYYMADYYLFEGEWSGWFRDDQFDTRRERCMKSIVSQRGGSIDQVSSLLQWNYVNFDKNGYRTNSNLNINGGYAKFVGVNFDFKNKRITYLLQPCSLNTKQGQTSNLFNTFDIQDMISLGVVSGAFTLDQPCEPNEYVLASNPYQEMKFTPQCIERTNYLATLLHVDYLLKMFTMGVEVSNQYPFAIKSSEDLIRKCPEHIKKVLNMLKDEKQTDRAHRFWIEAGDAVFNVEKNGENITYTFQDIKMKCKTHLLKRDKYGNYVDDDDVGSSKEHNKDKNNKEEEDETMEDKFAKEFTKYYDEIAYYFPEFARLKELIKMGLLTLILNGKLASFTEALNDVKVDRKLITDHLSKIATMNKYPMYSDSKVESELDDVLRQNGVSRYQVKSSELTRVRNSIKDQLQEADKKIKEIAINSIVKSYGNVTSYEISGYIENLLKYGHKDNLATFLEGKLILAQKEEINQCIRMVKDTGVNSKITKPDQLSNNGQYCLVPAGFAQVDGSYRIYGGVNAGVNPVQVQSGGSNGGCGANTARYIEGVNQKGQWYCNAIALNGITAQQQHLSSGYISLNPNLNTQAYWAPRWDSSAGNTHHTTLHRDIGRPHNYYVHYCDGSTFRSRV